MAWIISAKGPSVSQVNSTYNISTARQSGATLDRTVAAASDMVDKFAALLPPPDRGEAPSPKSASAATTQPDAHDKRPDANPTAASIEAPKPIENNAPPDADLTRLIDDLSDLRATLDKGDTPTPEQLDAIAKALEKLADKFGLSLDNPLNAEQLAALTTQALPADATLSDQLAKVLAPITQSLGDGKGQTQALGAKLAAFLSDLGAAKAMPGVLPELDATTTTRLDPALADALTRLLKPTSGHDAPATVLATPNLKAHPINAERKIRRCSQFDSEQHTRGDAPCK
ncbi:hypothetical protein PSQ19_09445 [Devosia algicola]|uniref:Flagellar hook-length control protein FliK n=1 Tax=Devosia algicola TaxID=3026418 RepID=A0ABY7YSG1_9HYPH|nr:hypothetical protein [Devosia algicola]WDR04186.1 hypothetical protein PSQ19_09445 [Devosia algicola]